MVGLGGFAMVLLLLSACLERVTGEAVPLDPAFYAAHEGEHGEGGVGGGSSVPFSDVDGEKVTVRGVISSEIEDLPVDIDVRIPDAAAPGGVAGKGKILLDAPGDFELSVPAGLGKLELQAFQDADSDGPTGDDPFAEVWLDVGSEDLEGVELALEAGMRGGGPVHEPAPAGAPGGGSHGGPGGNTDPFSGIAGPRVVLKGRLICDCTGSVDLDLFKPDPTAPGGRAMLGKMKMAPGPYELHVPEHFGPLILEGFVDLTGDGPSAGDAMGKYTGNPINIGENDLDNVDITLAVPADGMMPQGEPNPPPRPEDLQPGAPPPAEGI